jgi:hypothetical protein
VLGNSPLIDAYFLLQKYPLDDLLSFFYKKFHKIQYNKIHLLKSLSYFQDAEEDPMPKMIKKTDWKKVKARIEQESLKQLNNKH